MNNRCSSSRTFVSSLLIIGALLVFSQPVAAQATAAVVGTIRDPTGATVPGARVSVTNVQTALVASSTTGTDGTYTILLLPVGEYRLQVEAAGFQAYVRSGITLAVNDKPTIDVTLQVGNLADSVTVTEATPLIEAQTGTLRGLVDRQRIVDLPLNGRDMRQLLTIQAGVLKTSDSSTTGEGIAYAVNGSRGNGVSYLLDGGYNTSTYRNWAGTYPNPDAVQEFSFQRNSFSAEYGSAFGGVVSVVTRSGTNEFHGSAFEFVRNYLFNARNFFATQRDSLKRNQFGGTFGGPVIKDKLFFFAAFQQTYLRSNAALTTQFLPTAAQRAGNFSSVARAITDPLTGQVFPGNQIPASRISPVTQAFLKYLPDPGTPTGQRLTGAPSIINAREFTGRVDYNLSKHRISGKFFGNWQTSPFDANPNDIAYPLTRNDNQPYRQISATDSYTISSTAINSATFAYRFRERNDSWGDFDYPISYTTAGIRNVALPKPHGLYIAVSGYFSATPSWPYDIKDADWSWSDNFTYVRGRHELKFGSEILHSSNQIFNLFRQFGNYTFSGAITTNALADFMLGSVYQFWQGGGEYKNLSGNRYGLFALDNLRLSPNLTLNLGLRWDPTNPYTDSLGRVQCFVANQQSTRFPNAPLGYLSAGDRACPDGGFESYFRALAPRFGFAWRPGGGKSVVRGGFGLFWDPLFTVAYNTFVDSAPFSPQATLYGVSFDDPYKGYSNPFPAQFAPFKPPTDVPFFTPLGQFGVFVPNFRPSYMEGYNLTVEREVARNLVARASYVGNLGRHLSYSLDDNYARYLGASSTVANTQQRRPYQNYGSILNNYANGTSSYQGLQIAVERRVTAGLSFEANYTFSQSIDVASSDPTPGQGMSIIPYNLAANRGIADFNVPHRFVASSVYALPALAGQSAWVRQLAGGWQASGILTLQSGLPLTVFSGLDNSFSAINADHADIVGNPYLDTSRPRNQLLAQYFNTAAFSRNALGTFGTAPRNFIAGPGTVSLDMAAMKTFRVRERLRLDFRGEFFNLPNRPNFGSPVTTFTSPNFGKITSAADPRIVQFALKLAF
jgi:hypothetical protein